MVIGASSGRDTDEREVVGKCVKQGTDTEQQHYLIHGEVRGGTSRSNPARNNSDPVGAPSASHLRYSEDG